MRHNIRKVYRAPANRMKIIFPFDPFLLKAVRKVPGARWYKKEKYWLAPLTIYGVECLLRAKFKLAPRLSAWYDNQVEAKTVVYPELHTVDLKIMRKHLKGGTLRPFQRTGVRYLETRKGRALLADDMGLGKTIETLGWLAGNPKARPVVVVCPPSVKIKWQREANSWLKNARAVTVWGETPGTPKEPIVIINYDILSYWVKALKKMKPQVVVLDEAHWIKNPKAERTKAAKRLCRSVPHLIGLTGTPIENRASEFFSILHLLRPNEFKSHFDFMTRYTDAELIHGHWTYKGVRHAKELHRRLSDPRSGVMLRRLKSDVATQLPKKTRSVVPLRIDNRREYSEAETDFLAWLKQCNPESLVRAQRAEALTRTNALLRLAAQGKINACLDWISTFLGSPGEQVVVFVSHRWVAHHIRDAFRSEALLVDGSVTGTKRQKAIDQFQNGSHRLLVANIKALREGVNLTAASNAAMVELIWSPMKLSQAEDRLHRIGQVDPVLISYLVAVDTIEERMLEILDAKWKGIQGVIDGTRRPTGNMLTTLLSDYKRKGRDR